MAKTPITLPVSVMQRIDAVCDRFEADWRAGKKPRIEEYMGGEEAERAELLRALLKLEIELAGNGRNQAAFESRFVEHASVVRSVFAELPRQPGHSASTVDMDQDSVRDVNVAPPLPVKIGRFEIKALLGQGAFGKVYRARDPQLDRDVAVKVPLKGELETPQEVERFLREARAAAALHHPNLCPVYEVGQENGGCFIVMALVEGKPLSVLLKERGSPLPARQAALIVRKVALALAATHAKGIVHRDLKPANIMIERERKDVIVMDFGLARHRKTGDPKQTKQGVIMGTPAYMAPEQARGDMRAVGPASDVYSLGVILYEMLAGRPPFTGSLTEVLGKVLHVEPERPSVHHAAVDPALEAICLKAMAKDPKDRHASMKELAAALDGFLKGVAEETARPKQTTREDAGQMTRVAEALSAERREETHAAIEEVVRRSRIPLWRWLVGAAALAAVVVAGIIFFARTPTATVMINIEGLDVKDAALAFYLDEKNISREELLRPIELKVGDHELRVMRGEEEVRRYRFVVLGGRDPGIQVTEMRPGPGERKKREVNKEADLPVPVAHWTFDGPADSLAVDRIGRIKQGKVVGTVKQVPGKFGKAAEFPGGEKNHIDVPHQTLLDIRKQLTVSAWVKLAADSAVGTVVRKWYGADSFQLAISPGGAGMVCNFPTGDEWGVAAGAQSPKNPRDWTHVAGTFDGTDICVYINGKLAKRQPVIDFPPMRKSKMFLETGKVPKELQPSTVPLLLGFELKGQLDEVMMFDVALTPSQVEKLAGPGDGSAEDGAGSAGARALEQWQGMWQEEGGVKLTINGDRWSHTAVDGRVDSGKLKIIEVGEKWTSADMLRDDGRTIKSIYRLEGNTLHYCGTYNKVQPTEFKTDGDNVYFVWKRTKASDPDRAAAEWVLSIGGNVSIADPARIPHTFREVTALPAIDKVEALPKKPFKVVGFTIRGAEATDAAVARLAQLPSLRYVYVEESTIGDESLRALAANKDLVSLQLGGATNVTNRGAQHLAALTKLEYLRMTHTQITDDGLAAFAGLPELWYLDVTLAKITGSGLKHLHGLPKLTALKIAGPALTDDGLAALPGLTRLDHLDIAWADGVTNAGLKHLAGMKHLGVLDLWSKNVTDEGLAHLAKLDELLTLGVRFPLVTDDGLRHLAALGRLQSLQCAPSKVTGAGLKHLTKLDELRILILADCPVSDEGLKGVVGLKRLENLNLVRTPVSDASVDTLKKLTKLRELFLNDSRMSDAGLLTLQKALPSCRISPAPKME